MQKLLSRFGFYTLGSTLMLAILFMPEVALAQAGGTNDALKNFSEIAATLVHVISAAAMIMIQFFPPLWGSELITGDQVTEMLRPMWIYVRNICNIAFVGMLLFLALSNMVTSGKGIAEWNIKTKLPKIILGLVAINFSMLAVRVLVDVVHVGTVALLSIADPVIDARGIDNVADYYSRSIDTETFEPCEEGSGGNCKTVRELVNSTFCTSPEACLFEIREISEIQAAAETMTNPERKNIMLAFGTFFMKLESLPLLSADTGGILDVLDSALFSLVFGVAYLLALLAMMVVLLVRVVMMWIFIIFSPILVTSWVMEFSAVKMISDQFWGYLLVPVKAAAALAFGFVMISQLELMTIPPEFYVSVIEPGSSLKALWGPDEYGGWRMLWKVLTVVLFWKVVFDFALADVKGMEKIVGGIKGAGESFGKFALSATGEQIKLPNPMGEGSITATDMGGMLLRGNRTLSAAATRMSRPGNDDEGMLGALRAASGATERADSLAPALRRITTQAAAQTHLQGQSQREFLDDYRAANADTREHLRRVFNLATPGSANDIADGASLTDVERVIGARGEMFSGSRDDGDTDPVVQPVTVNRDGDTNNFSISVDGAANPISVTGAEAGDRQTALATELAGINSMTVDRVREIARTIATQDPDYLGNASTAEAALVSAFNTARGS